MIARRPWEFHKIIALLQMQNSILKGVRVTVVDNGCCYVCYQWPT